MFLLSTLMQDDLHVRSHILQPIHFDLSITGFSNEYFDIAPKIVPTGQIVLQYVRPFFHAKTAITTNVTIATTNVVTLFTYTSTE